MHTGGGGGGGRGRVNRVPPQANFKTLVNNNAIKPEIGGPPQAIFPESLDPPAPLGILAKNIRYPLPWVFNLCASMSTLGAVITCGLTISDHNKQIITVTEFHLKVINCVFLFLKF
jgi:hypothetical protein